ncbi:CPBP family intramembrane glutamic endopeptidase [Promicromonospora iranensis]|uniref:Membrane protease YdiL (CAAX protease family) n=1 Tax=Promicromonospora iranensis TaxID=1105144 RepID=A0ABU2CUF7_9MICO|nr:CPBP family intramembrane glutamic endopeptidase [Promicromonospora iranensis]MDR7384782.1 membrane protease YdiL (CAAX protease family) [Promicromonospora iranensis]
MRLVWQLLAVVAVSFLGSQGSLLVGDSPWLALVVGLVTAVVAVLVYAWVVRRTEHRAVVEVSRQGAASGLAWGTLLGVALFSLVIVSLAFLGSYTVHGLGTTAGAVGLLGVMASVAVVEELIFRGVLFRIIKGWTGTWIALVLTSVLFGLVHLVNPNATLWGALAIAIAGGMLTAAYVATHKLWVPIGLHFGWNIAGSAIFSTEVSGNNTPQGLLDATTSGPVLITGGEFGPEGSLFSIVFCLLVAAVFMRLAYRRGHVIPRRRGTRADAAVTLPR